MDVKTLLAGVSGGIALYILGFLFYVILFPNFFDISIAKDPPDYLLVGASEVVFGILLAWLLSSLRAITPGDGMKAGALLGFLFSAGWGLLLHATTTMADSSFFIAEVFVWSIRWSLAGAVVGWILGRSAKVPAR